MCRIRYKESPPYHTKKYKDDYDEDFCSYGKMGRLKKQKQNYQKKEHRQIAWKHDIKTYWKHRQGEKCCYCGNKLTEENLTAEHIKPYSKGGKFTITNIRVACVDCNSKRGNNDFFPTLKYGGDSHLDEYAKIFMLDEYGNNLIKSYIERNFKLKEPESNIREINVHLTGHYDIKIMYEALGEIAVSGDFNIFIDI